jgi:hypothetical protein
MSFTRQQIASACRQYGPTVAPLPPGIDGTQLLFAMTGNESSFGANVTPRHEPAFDVGGVYGKSPQMQALLAKFGSAAACSYGPLQLLFCNTPAGAKPSDFNDLNTAFGYSVAFLNKLLTRFRPQTLGDIGSCWNGGHIQNPYSPAVQVYVNRLTANYAVQMPAVE